MCTDPKFSGIAALCPAAVETYEVSGPLSFHADGTVVSALQLTFHDSVPASCVATLGGCGAASGVLASCTATANGGCECNSPSTVTPPVNQRYAASGNQLLLTDDDNTSLAFYCQSGNQLKMRGKSAGTIFQYSLTRM